jgi:hypothetical protein
VKLHIVLRTVAAYFVSLPAILRAEAILSVATIYEKVVKKFWDKECTEVKRKKSNTEIHWENKSMLCVCGGRYIYKPKNIRNC